MESVRTFNEIQEEFDYLMERAEERCEKAFMDDCLFEKVDNNNFDKLKVEPSNIKKFIKLGLGKNTLEKGNDVNVLLDEYEFVTEELIESRAAIKKEIPYYLSTTDYVYAWKMHEMLDYGVLILSIVRNILEKRADELEKDKNTKYNCELDVIIGYLANETQNMNILSEVLEDALDFETNIEYLQSL